MPKNNSVLYLAVFTCGAVVMVFELLASRILGPYLGTSFYTWTSIIGVILASLSLGYAVGGKWADQKADLESLSKIILFSALTLCLTVLIEKPVLTFLGGVYRFDIEVRSVMAASVLFALPSFCLAMITPYSVKIQLSGLKHSAATVGSLYALSTLGSILGTFLAGFVLIPFFGTALLMNILIIVLLVISLLVAFREQIWLKLVLILAVIFLIYSNATQVAAMTHEDPLSIDTKYNTVWLYNYIDRESQKPVLGLFFDPFDIQSAMFVDDPDKLVFAYTKFYRLAEYFEPGFKKALMIGGCAYSFPKYFLSNYKEALIDVVEIDQGLTEIAKKYFHLEPTDHLRVFHEDGRTYLNETAEKYDVIYGDAFNAASAVPFQLTTEESVGKMKDILNDNGVVIINLIGSLKGDGADFPRAEYATFKKVFGNQVYLFKVKNYSADNLQNLVLVALKGEDRLAERKTDFLDDELKIMLLDKKIDFQDLPEFYNSQLVLTDDFAPVEYYKYKSLR